MNSEASEATQNKQPQPDHGTSKDDASHEATIVLHGEAVADQQPTPATVVVRGETSGDRTQKSPPKAAQAENREAKSEEKGGKDKSSPPPLSQQKVQMQARLPALEDDADTGAEKDQLVTRDGKPDLAFTGTLIASAAPSSAPKGQWEEFRIYSTNAGKHVFSKTGRSINADQEDTHEAEIFDPAPSSMPSKLLKSARDLTHSREKTWQDAAADFFGYDSLAKELYRKLGGQFEERIS